MKRWSLATAVLLVCTQAAFAQERVDLDMTAKIRQEAFARSQVMKTLDHLTDVIGPRLTLSPSMLEANRWTRSKFTEWGMANVHDEAIDDLGGTAADYPMGLGFVGSQFQHVAQDGDAAAGHLLEEVQRGEARVGAAVVGIIEERCAVEGLDHDQAHLGRLGLQASDNLLPGQTFHQTDGDGAQGGVDAVAADQGRIDAQAVTLVVYGEGDTFKPTAVDPVGP